MSNWIPHVYVYVIICTCANCDTGLAILFLVKGTLNPNARVSLIATGTRICLTQWRYLVLKDVAKSTCTNYNIKIHDDVIKWKHFPRYWPFVWGIHLSITFTKASDAELWCFWCLNKRLNKQSRHRWFETPSHALWRHCNDNIAWAVIIFDGVCCFCKWCTPMYWYWD